MNGPKLEAFQAVNRSDADASVVGEGTMLAGTLADRDLPVVANAAAAIPETLGDGGILLENNTPETVAAQLERVVRDHALRKDLIEKGRRRVDAFSRSHVADRLKLALAQGGWDLPDAKSKKVVVMSSDQRCGLVALPSYVPVPGPGSSSARGPV